VLVRHEAAQEMRDRPLGTGLQEQVPNRLRLHGLRALVVSVDGNGNWMIRAG
jgi:hypothetical protein